MLYPAQRRTVQAACLTNNPTLSYALQHMYQPADNCYVLSGLPSLINTNRISSSFFQLFYSFRCKIYWKFTLQEYPHKYGLFFNFIFVRAIHFWKLRYKKHFNGIYAISFTKLFASLILPLLFFSIAFLSYL